MKTNILGFFIFIFVSYINFNLCSAQTIHVYEINKNFADTLSESKFLRFYGRSGKSFDLDFNIKEIYKLSKTFSVKESQEILKILSDKKNFRYTDCGSYAVLFIFKIETNNSVKIYEFDSFCRKLSIFDKDKPNYRNPAEGLTIDAWNFIIQYLEK